jgi:hypothetical protein
VRHSSDDANAVRQAWHYSGASLVSTTEKIQLHKARQFPNGRCHGAGRVAHTVPRRHQRPPAYISVRARGARVDQDWQRAIQPGHVPRDNLPARVPTPLIRLLESDE